jgi:hypothetical protein
MHNAKAAVATGNREVLTAKQIGVLVSGRDVDDVRFLWGVAYPPAATPVGTLAKPKKGPSTNASTSSGFWVWRW